MTNGLKIFKCEVCGKVLEVVNPGSPDLTCCETIMTEMEAKTTDAGSEKHVPVMESAGDDLAVKVGSVPHPMEAEHYITWVQIISGGEERRIFLKPGQEPRAIFRAVAESAAEARVYCNIHGLWKSE